MANERIISADSHVNPPKDLWTSRAPARLRERVPRVESTPQGDFWIVDSQVSGAIGLDASAGHKPEDFRPAGMAYKDMRPGPYDPPARLADMDIDGVDAARRSRAHPPRRPGGRHGGAPARREARAPRLPRGPLPGRARRKGALGCGLRALLGAGRGDRPADQLPHRGAAQHERAADLHEPDP